MAHDYDMTSEFYQIYRNYVMTRSAWMYSDCLADPFVKGMIEEAWRNAGTAAREYFKDWTVEGRERDLLNKAMSVCKPKQGPYQK